MGISQMTASKRTDCLIGAIVALCCLPFPAHAESLFIQVEPADAERRTGPDVRWTVFLEGMIDVGAADRLGQELAQLGDDRADIYIDSPGGSLADGMRIGRLLRRVRANTLLGKRGSRNSGIEPGVCLSACSIAFLGGVKRYAPGGSVFGVHRISTAVHSDQDFAAGQIVAAQVSGYIREMGVDSLLFDRMAGTDKDRIYILGASEMHALHVVDDGRRPAQWRSRFTEQGPSLIGYQETEEGKEQAILSCDKGQVIFRSIYQAASNTDGIAIEQQVHSLLINDTALPLDAPSSIEEINGDIDASFALSSDQARRMIGATSIGHLAQGSRSDPPFAFEIDIDARAGRTGRIFIESCTGLR